MEEFFIEIFGSYGRIIVFVHVISAAILIGSLFTLAFVIKPALMKIDDEQVRYNRCLKVFEHYSYIVLPVMLLLISASLMMSVGLGFEYASPTLYSLIHVKEALWIFMMFNFVFMYYKFISAKRCYLKRDFIEVHENITLVINYLIPLNLILTFIAVFIGVIIRGM